ncbi:MAG: hypothetical protein ACR2ND_06030 [Solirubrobacteraceae bacterium]
MDVSEARAGLAARGPAGACTDGERRSGAWAREQLRRSGHTARLECEWVRPGWPSVFASHGVLAVVGSVLSATGAELVGMVLVALAAISLLGELSGRARLLRQLLPARATQNLVAPSAEGSDRPRLVVYANLDAPRARSTWFPPALLWGAIVLLVLLAGLRLDGESSGAVAIAQFAASVLVLVGVASLIELAVAEPGDASPAAATALALFAELRSARLRELDVELVLGGAGDGQGLGLARYIAARGDWPHESVVLLSIEHDVGPRTVGWLVRDGQLLPLRLHPRLCLLMAHAAAGEAGLDARGRRAWGCSGAYVARRAGWPAIAVEGAGAAAVLELCMAWVGLLDVEFAQAGAGSSGELALRS